MDPRLRRAGRQLKLTLESFRTIYPEDGIPEGQYAAFFNRALYAPYAKTMREFFKILGCAFLDKMMRTNAG